MGPQIRTPGHVAVVAVAVAVLIGACTSPNPAASNPAPPAAPTSELEAFASRAVGAGAPAVVLHVRNGSQEEAKASGARNLNSREPAEAGDRLWISGAGAPMVAVAVLKLVEKGAIRLDDPVSDHLPEFGAILPGWQRTTIRELLGSRSGLPDYIPSLLESRTVEELQVSVLTFEERLRIAAGTHASPGPLSRAAWSATDWEVLAWLLERVHGRVLADVLLADVFRPAGMADTLVAAPGPPPEPMLHGYVLDGGNRLDFTRTDIVAGSGDAGIISTVADLNRFFAALPAGRLVSMETWKSMVEGDPYDLGGLQQTDGICPGQRHVFVRGGGGAYNVQSISSLDGRQQVSVGMALPPAELDVSTVPPLITRMEEAARSTAASMCASAQ
ncbi:serine hydrolase [Pseudarthrobacter sp. GA104]|uniref:serine hydrolase domain-containing protein n=1 Tax=Pseudarthrobacter sp. GA104 TaxID=2676311 RepID=UPI0012F8B160|nr:serine hydrolase domain-containing protein [Pseudarthrobacter sp. GA104]MUU72476.1 serine hydrolase [Pseudarthrobacter sp. GA104]